MLKILGNIGFSNILVRRKSNFAVLLTEAVDERLSKMEAAKDERRQKQKFSAKEKYNGAVKRRKWEDLPEGGLNPNFDPSERIKRKKSIILLGYSGVNYYGMQRNPDMKTIEEDLLLAMLKNKWISEEHFKTPQAIQFQRAARTDKGVSACQQVVSVKLPEQLDIEALNKDLPEQIKVFAVKRVTKGFNSKTNCDARTYTYTLPTATFADHNEEVNHQSYRLPEEKFTKVNQILKLYEGTKNYHNFTRRKDFHDPSSKRHMFTVECEKPFLPEGSNLEFAVVKIKGQSFMLYQIRKMMGLIIAIMRGLTPSDTINKAFQKEKIDIPTAPGLGLVLSRIHYDRYNVRFGTDGVHETLTFEQEIDDIEDFFRKHIVSTILKTEVETNSMQEWVVDLHKHNYEEREDKKDEKNDKPNDEDEDE